MKARLIIATLTATLALVGCDWRAVEKCDKRGGGMHRCETIWVPVRHHMKAGR